MAALVSFFAFAADFGQRLPGVSGSTLVHGTTVGPTGGNVHAARAAITSEPIGGTRHTAVDTLHNKINRHSHGDRPPMAIAGCHIKTSKMYDIMYKCNNPDSQFPGPNPGRKCLSRRVARRTVLALEWPEMIQIDF